MEFALHPEKKVLQYPGMNSVRQGKLHSVSLTSGSVPRGILAFAFPIFLGQLLQQLYNFADAWVIGNFADHNSFAAVSSGGSLTFLIIGFFSGIAVGGGVVISRYYGAGDDSGTSRAVHANVAFGLISSAAATLLGLLFVPQLLRVMNIPESVFPRSLEYFHIYFAGVSTVILYNIGTSILQASGDSLHPLLYLAVSSAVNVILDLLFVAGFSWGVRGAAAATVLSQGLSAVLCFVHLFRDRGVIRVSLRKLRWDSEMMKAIVAQGLPTGVQNAVISLGNVVIQSNINAFGSYAMAGHGAYARLEGLTFLPISSMSMSIPTFVSQNLGAKLPNRARKGAAFSIVFSMILAELVGVFMYFFVPQLLRFFTDSAESIAYGTTFSRTTCFFYCLLAFSHCVAGTLRGCGKPVIPMVVMLGIWCGLRIVYVTIAVQFFPVFRTIAWAYPLTWSVSSVLYAIALIRVSRKVLRAEPNRN